MDIKELGTLINDTVKEQLAPIQAAQKEHAEKQAQYEETQRKYADIFEQKEVGFYDGKTFRHNIFADWLLENHDYRLYGDVIYSYEDGLYVPDDNIVNKRICFF